MLFEEFCRKYGLKNASTSSDEIYKVVKELGLNDFGIYTDNQKLKTKCGLINLDEKGRGTHWVCYYENNYFDSFGGPPSENIDRQLSKIYVYSTYQIQSIEESLCAAYCLYILYLILCGRRSGRSGISRGPTKSQAFGRLRPRPSTSSAGDLRSTLSSFKESVLTLYYQRISF